MVKKSPFMKIGVMGIGPDREEPAGQFEHVVDIARLGCTPVHALTQLSGCSEIFVLTVTAGGKAVVLHDLVPEKARSDNIPCTSLIGVAIS